MERKEKRLSLQDFKNLLDEVKLEYIPFTYEVMESHPSGSSVCVILRLGRTCKSMTYYKNITRWRALISIERQLRKLLNVHSWSSFTYQSKSVFNWAYKTNNKGFTRRINNGKSLP